MTPERVKDYDMRNKQRGLQQQRELCQRAREFADREAELKLSAKQWSLCRIEHDALSNQQLRMGNKYHFFFRFINARSVRC